MHHSHTEEQAKIMISDETVLHKFLESPEKKTLRALAKMLKNEMRQNSLD